MMSTKLKQADQDEAFSASLNQEPVGALTIVALEREGWEFYQSDDDQSWIGENVDKGLRTVGGIVFTKEDAVRAALDLLKRQESKAPAGAVPEKWFRKAPIPEDPNNRLVEDLGDTELRDVLVFYGEQTAIGKAITLELELRDKEFQFGQSTAAEDVPDPEASEDDWFLNYQLPNKQMLSDLTDDELADIANSPMKEMSAAAGSLIAWRKEKEVAEHLDTIDVVDLQGARTVYQKYRADLKDCKFTQLNATFIEAMQNPEVNGRWLQAIRDAMNELLGYVISETGVYAHKQTITHKMSVPAEGNRVTHGASFTLMETQMGWIYGYTWFRGRAKAYVPLTSRQAFDQKEDALIAACEAIHLDNSPALLADLGPADKEYANAIQKWANSFITPEVPEVIDDEAVEELAPAQIESSLDIESGLIPVGELGVQASLFDYSRLDTETAVFVKRQEVEITDDLKRSLSDNIRIGAKLEAVFQAMPGHFTEWVTTCFSMSERWARDCRKVAKVFDGVDVERFHWKALVQLAQDDVPREIRQEFVEQAQSGETITKQTVTTKIKEVREVEEQRSPMLPGVELPSAPGAGVDITGMEEIESSNAELVASGRTSDDMVSLLKATPSGASFEQLITMGFSENQISAAQTDRKIERRDLKYFYRWTPADVVAYIREHGQQSFLQLEEAGFSRYAVESALMDDDLVKSPSGIYDVPENVSASENPEIKQVTPAPQPVAPPDYMAMLKGRSLVVNIAFLPALPDFLNLRVQVGDDQGKANYSTPDFALLNKLPKEILQVIVGQIEQADKEPKPKPEPKKAPAKKPATKKATPAKPGVPAKKAPAPATKKAASATKAPNGAKAATKPAAKKTSAKPKK
jgi:hypothetical protein